MGIVIPYPPIKLIFGILFSKTITFDLILENIECHFGKIDYVGSCLNFSHTNYYKAEMGESLKKTFLSISKPYDANNLYQAKLISNQIEILFSLDKKRQVNIDPGALSLHNLILLSTKNFAHRIPLQQGIYAEVSLLYQKNNWAKLPWSYPDFEYEEHLATLSEIRKIYKNQVLIS